MVKTRVVRPAFQPAEFVHIFDILLDRNSSAKARKAVRQTLRLPLYDAAEQAAMRAGYGLFAPAYAGGIVHLLLQQCAQALAEERAGATAEQAREELRLPLS
jgi:hypothetical protein